MDRPLLAPLCLQQTASEPTSSVGTRPELGVTVFWHHMWLFLLLPTAGWPGADARATNHRADATRATVLGGRGGGSERGGRAGGRRGGKGAHSLTPKGAHTQTLKGAHTLTRRIRAAQECMRTCGPYRAKKVLPCCVAELSKLPCDRCVELCGSAYCVACRETCDEQHYPPALAGGLGAADAPVLRLGVPAPGTPLSCAVCVVGQLARLEVASKARRTTP